MPPGAAGSTVTSRARFSFSVQLLRSDMALGCYRLGRPVGNGLVTLRSLARSCSVSFRNSFSAGIGEIEKLKSNRSRRRLSWVISLSFARRGITFTGKRSMRLKFYGTRGSIPICDASFQQFGGNTTCLQITFTDMNRIAVIDAGTGLRNLGRDLRAIGHKQERIVIAFTHFHWDHIQGFPFFAQAYDPGQKITLLTLGRDQTVTDLREIFEVQMQEEYFPVQLDRMGATFEFLQIADASTHITGINDVETFVSAQRHNHPGGAYSFRVERNGKVLVVCTDVEHGEQIDPRLVELARGADLLVHDAQYTAEELQKRRGWGHSSFDQAMQVAEMAGVKRLALTHHDPEHDDEFLQRIEKLCQERFPNAVLAREGMEISL